MLRRKWVLRECTRHCWVDLTMNGTGTMLSASPQLWSRASETQKASLSPPPLALALVWQWPISTGAQKIVDGRVSLGLNPDGPTDRQIGLIRLQRPDGTPIAVIANYAMHGTAMSGANLLVSGDAPGTVSAYVEQKIGAPVLYVNGAAGNMAPIYSVYPDPRSAHLSQFNVLLGDHILAALNAMGAPTSDVSLFTDEKIIETRRKDGLEWPAELPEYARAQADGTALVRLPVRFLKINATLIWSAPVELFCELAIAIRNQSPFEHTFYFGYTNGWIGYLPTSKAFDEGGYEPKTSVFTGSAERDVLNGVTTYIQGSPK